MNKSLLNSSLNYSLKNPPLGVQPVGKSGTLDEYKNFRKTDVASLNHRMTDIKAELTYVKNEMNKAFNQIISQVEDYVDWYFNDKFADKMNETEDKKYKRCEAHFDMIHETYLRNE